MKMIACIQEDGGLGYKGELLYWFKEDLDNFKQTTLDQIVVMGYNTWESLPKKPLPHRINMVLVDSEGKGKSVEENGGIYLSNIEALKLLIPMFEVAGKSVYIIGGGFVYNQMIEHCDEVILTEVRGQNKLADTFFPLDKLNERFTKVSEKELLENVYLCTFKLNM